MFSPAGVFYKVKQIFSELRSTCSLFCSLTYNVIQHNKHNCYFSSAWVQALIELYGNTLMTHRKALCTRTSWLHPFTVYPTSLALRLNMHKSSAGVYAWTTVPVPGLKGAGEHISCIFSCLLSGIDSHPSKMFLQASCQVHCSTAHGCVVKAGKGRGYTGHCNGHLWNVSH